MWFPDPEHHEALRRVVGQLSTVVEIELLEGFQDVIETPQALPALLIIVRLEHRDSLLGADRNEGAAHLVRTFELQPVAGAFQNLQSKIPLHVLSCFIDGPLSQRGVMVERVFIGAKDALAVASNPQINLSVCHLI